MSSEGSDIGAVEKLLTVLSSPHQKDSKALLVIATPHGGREILPALPERTQGVRDGDTDTDILANLLHHALLSHISDLKIEISTIIAHLQRKYCDLNSPRGSTAFESTAVSAFYDTYHRTIHTHLGDPCCAGFPLRILIDFHGQSNVKTAILYRTKHGASSLHKHFEAELVQRLQFKEKIDMIHLDADPKLGRRFHGHTVDTYGSATVFAIQIEVGRTFRSSAAQMSRIADQLSDAILGSLITSLGP